MKRYTVILIILSVMTLVFCMADAEQFDAAEYSYEELQVIQQKISERLEELDRQQAIENVDRRIVFDEAEKTVFLKRTLKAEPEVIRISDNATRWTAIKWSSSNPRIASVTSKGIITGVAPGDAVITATASDNEYVSGSFAVHVVIPVEKITVWGQDAQLLLSRNADEAVSTLDCSIEPEDAYYQGVTWSSSDETIVRVDENGTIRGLKPGRAVITATSTEPRSDNRPPVSAKYRVTVQQAVTSLELNANELTLSAGESKTLQAAVMPEDADDPTVFFRSSDTEIAAVDADGKVTARGSGECEISCEAADGSGITATCHVTVIKKVSGLAVTQSEVRLSVGETYEAETLISPEDATNQKLRWTSSNVFVARVADGRIEGISQGNCVITCATTDGSNLSQQITVIIPTFSVKQTEYTVTEKAGLEIPIQTNKEGIQITLTTGGDCFRAERTQRDMIRIIPVSAGTGTITLSNPRVPKDDVTLTITVENSAVFNQKSYPPFDYTATMENPEEYAGKPVSTSGKVLQIGRGRDGETIFMVGTGGEQFTDQVLLVRCDNALIPADMKQEEMLTLYGKFHLETIYSDALAVETQIPAMTAEKIEKTE